MTLTVEHCRSCAGEIIWCVTAAGKRMPVDAWPAEGGNMRILDETPPRAVYAGQTIDLIDETDDGTRYVSHFVSCPESREWRKR